MEQLVKKIFFRYRRAKLKLKKLPNKLFKITIKETTQKL